MPSATMPRTITQQETAEALRQQIGDRYKVTPHARDKLTVSHGLAFASVHLAPDGNATAFHVHGGGLIVARIINELGIARKVTGAIKESLGSAQAS